MKIRVSMRELNGWNQQTTSRSVVWFKGYVLNRNTALIFKEGMEFLNNPNTRNNELSHWAKGIRGHFSFVIICNNKALCMVDNIKSVPLFYTYTNNELFIGNCAPHLAGKDCLDSKTYHKQSALEIAMSGYTIGNKTLQDGLFQLQAGELLVAKDKGFKLVQYYQYAPWNTEKKSKKLLKKELTDVSIAILEDMVESSNDRQIVIPLSAGNDSRFIASGLKKLGVKNVLCFSYGVANNFEVETAKSVADKLGYKWTYTPLSISSQKKYFSEEKFRKYCEFSDTLSNSPVLIDYSAISKLHDSGLISNDAIIVNGNSGDFLTGGHISGNIEKDFSHQQDVFLNMYIDKHYSLWDCLKTKDNLYKIRKELENIVNELMNRNSLSNDLLWAVGENIEWSGRQSKFVTATQRSYEFHGYDWRLPLWDPIYMDFWEGVPKEYKLDQKLFKEMLVENNWGGVWDDIKVNDFKISSAKVRYLRGFSKIFFSMVDREKWREFDKKVFGYFVDSTASTAIESYYNVLIDNCGARNRNSWIVKKYLKCKGLGIAQFTK